MHAQWGRNPTQGESLPHRPCKSAKRVPSPFLQNLLRPPSFSRRTVAKCRLPARPRPMAGGNARRTPLAVPRRFWLPLTRLRHRNLHYPARTGGTRCRSRTGSSFTRHVGSRWDSNFAPVQFVPPPQPTLCNSQCSTPTQPTHTIHQRGRGTMVGPKVSQCMLRREG